MQCMWGTIVGEEGWLQESGVGPHQVPIMPTERNSSKEGRVGHA